MTETTNIPEDYWTDEIKPKNKWYDINFKEIWSYRDLLFLFVRRDFVSVYKQTILGPVWFFIQPIFATLIYTVVFNKIAKISTGETPPILFNLAGVTIWNYFSDCLISTSNTFTSNANIFGKVYFPRLIVPMSVVISNLLKFGIQFTLFLGVYIYYINIGADISISKNAILFFPFLVFLMAGLGLGLGIIISSLTTKYRDLQFLVAFGVQLLMFATPVVYPLSAIKQNWGEYSWLISYNPLTPILETYKSCFFNTVDYNNFNIVYSFITMIILFCVGTIIFHKVEKSFMDTV